MTQISIIAICVQVLCLGVDDVRWHVCWCDTTLGEEQPSTDGTCQWIHPPLAISVLKTPAILWLYEKFPIRMYGCLTVCLQMLRGGKAKITWLAIKNNLFLLSAVPWIDAF